MIRPSLVQEDRSCWHQAAPGVSSPQELHACMYKVITYIYVYVNKTQDKLINNTMQAIYVCAYSSQESQLSQ
jgi:hypothetical protein